MHFPWNMIHMAHLQFRFTEIINKIGLFAMKTHSINCISVALLMHYFVSR